MYSKRNPIKNTISGYLYRLIVPATEQWSRVLLRTSREANRAFLGYYRLSIPLQPGASPLLHINPETDLLEVRRELSHSIEGLVAFLHDTVAYDPNGVGIRHLAMGRECEDAPYGPSNRDNNDITHLAALEPSKLNPLAVQAIKVLLSKSLKHFYSYSSVYSGARIMLHHLTAPNSPVHYNRSVPMAQNDQKQVMRFEMLETDPRPIDTDLAFVAAGTDPRRKLFFWYRFMTKFGVSKETHAMQIHYLHAFETGHRVGVHTRKGFLQYLKDNYAQWIRWARDFHHMSPWGQIQSEEEYRRLREELHDVVGFWVFDKTAFGGVPEQNAEDVLGKVNYKMMAGVTSHRPGLIVFDISDGLK